MTKTNIRKLLGIIAVLITAIQVQAGFFSNLDYKLHSLSSKHRIDNIIITGNFVKSRLLAELIQRKTKQPILLASPNESGGQEFFYMPYGEQAYPLTSDDLVEFIDLANPKQVIVLGDERYVPENVIRQVDVRQNMIKISSPNWAKNAETLADLFQYRKLPTYYLQYLQQIESSLTVQGYMP